MFISIQFLNELSYIVPVAQVLKLFKFSSKPEQPGLSSSTRLETVFLRIQLLKSVKNLLKSILILGRVVFISSQLLNGLS